MNIKKSALITVCASCLFATAFSQLAQPAPLQQPKKPRKVKQVVTQQNLALAQQLIAIRGNLASALPIYDGNRVRAMKLLERAAKILSRGNGGGGKKNAGPRPLPHPKSEGHNKSRYTAQQIAQSQQIMASAGQALSQIVSQISGPAGADVQQAIADIQAGIALHNH